MAAAGMLNLADTGGTSSYRDYAAFCKSVFLRMLFQVAHAMGDAGPAPQGAETRADLTVFGTDVPGEPALFAPASLGG